MEDFFKQLLQIYKNHVRIKQLKRKFVENFSRFYISFMDQYKDPKQKKDKYLKVKQIGLRYILENQDLLYSEVNK
jgi:hypothetical protein